jgi:signal transduction histidine kinase
VSIITRMDERIDELLFALRSAVEATMRELDDEDFTADQAWQHARKRLVEVLDEVLK